MTNVVYRSDLPVALVRHMASDEAVVQAAKVSTLGSDALGRKAGDDAGLINFLVKNRHGSPFEHTVFTWMIEAPIFVWREFMRHRIASYNEQSGRYMELAPHFYVPGLSRPLQQEGKPGHYEYVEGTVDQQDTVYYSMTRSYLTAWDSYQKMLEAGVAREVARMVLPVGIYSSAFVSMNARALTNFLSLRTKGSENATYPSYPMDEISRVADDMERDFARLMPITCAAWDNNGRVPL